MLILSNCLTDVADEGCLKVANSLVKRLKVADGTAMVVSYERRSPLTDIYMELNKFLVSRKLISLLRSRKEPVLYIPFPAKTIATAIRIFMLSCFSPVKPRVILTMMAPYSAIGKALLKMSGASLCAFSKEAADFYGGIVGPERVTYLKTGVDTGRFAPVSPEKARELKIKYGFDPDKKVILHVGHLNRGRNVSQLMKIAPEYQVLLVTSTLTKSEQDTALREELLKCPNIRLIDDYIPSIEEVYQLADVYFFPVVESCRCIDIPLSVLEAAACGKNVVTTDYGEMKQFKGKDGYFFISSFDACELNGLINRAIEETVHDIRQTVLDYDWSHGVSSLSK